VPESNPTPSKPTDRAVRSLINIAAIVAVATLISKVFGLVRQQAIAAAFGAGPAFGAYSFAYVVPGFLLILLGGINGPFHSAIVSVLAKRKREEAAPILETITTLVVGILLLVTILLIFYAEPVTRIIAPGLFVTEAQIRASGSVPADQVAQTFQTLQLTKDVAIQQFRIMAPMAVLAGLIGIGFGALNAADYYWLPSISPIFSSLTVITGIAGLAFYLGDKTGLPEYAALGGAVLAWSTLAGAVLQWLVQLPVQWKAGLGRFRPRFNFRQPEVQEVLRIMGPATFSSGMMQINVWTDLFFASFIPNAAAAVSAMSYAGLLVQTPVGILSNMILVPLMPLFARLSAPEQWDELKLRIRQGLLTTAVVMLPISALMIVLAVPISRAVYERYAFRPEDSYLTASVLVAYAIGMFVYLGRDIVVRVFYGLGDADTPFRNSIFNIFLNAFFDFLLVKPFGAPGIVLATVGVNIFSMVVLLLVLNRRLNGLPLLEWTKPVLGLAIASVIAGFASWGTFSLAERWLGSRGLLVLLLELLLASAVGMAIYVVLALQLKLPEFNLFVVRLRQKILRR